MVKPYFILLSSCLLLARASAVLVSIPCAEHVDYHHVLDENWSVHESMKQYVEQWDLTPCHQGPRVYAFHNTKIGDYYFCGSQDSWYWDLKNARDDDVACIGVAIFPNCRDAMKMALSERPFWQDKELTKDNTIVEQEGNTVFIRPRLESDPEKETELHTVMREGVLLGNIIWRNEGRKFTLSRQKELMMQVLDVVSSDRKHKDYSEELKALRKKNRDERAFHNDPCFGVPSLLWTRYFEDILIDETRTASTQFVHPQKMWGRPSWEWFDQFGGESSKKDKERNWNKCGGEILINFPEKKRRLKYTCEIQLVHATSAYHALRYMEGLVFKGLYYSPEDRWKGLKLHQIHPGWVGEYDVALKPQLDATGSLIPNAEESKICFVRNNTAVRVSASRPDVSVLWIAKKIDEELIAAGKGEPPTWTPPKEKTPRAAQLPL